MEVVLGKIPLATIRELAKELELNIQSKMGKFY